MKEFMLFIRNEGNPVADLSPERQQQHVEKVGGYIKSQVGAGKMKAAQPLEIDGSMLSFSNGAFVETPLDQKEEVISGYYQVSATDLKEAIEIAKADPRFEDGNWRIEIRPIMKIDGIN